MKNRKLIWQLPFLAFLIIGTVIIISQQRNLPYQSNHGEIFGTVYNVTYQCENDIHSEILSALKEVDQSLSPFNPTSTITKINKNESMKTDKMFVDVYNISQRVSAETNGAFDITVAPLVNLWGFGFRKENTPSKHAIDSLLRFVGYKKVTLNSDKTIKKEVPEIMLDCSAVAKGYGCDVVASVLKKHNVTNYMVEIGGEVVTKGLSPNRVPWRIGVNRPVDDPDQTSQELQTVLNVTDKAMATSGNYRNFYYKDGKKYAHTIDPHSGYPVNHTLLSATVLAQDCATADAYATSFMVMGIDKAKEVLKKHTELMAYFIYSDDKGDFKVWFSPSLADKIVDN